MVRKKEAPAAKQKGMLVLIGGREEETGPRSFLRKIVRLNNARTISIIPSASRHPIDISDKYRRAFGQISGAEVQVLDIRYRDEADLPEHLEAIKMSQLVFFTGGDQVRLVDLLDDTKLLRRIRNRHRQKGLTIAGSSAGAAAASDPMIFDGQDAGLFKGRVRNRKGFGFLPKITIDTHFIRRYRISRLAQVLSSGLSKRGIGIAENTALFVNPQGEAEVTGSGWVTILDADQMSFTNYADLEQDAQVSVTGLRVGFLAPKTRFHLKRWQVIREP